MASSCSKDYDLERKEKNKGSQAYKASGHTYI